MSDAPTNSARPPRKLSVKRLWRSLKGISASGTKRGLARLHKHRDAISDEKRKANNKKNNERQKLQRAGLLPPPTMFRPVAPRRAPSASAIGVRQSARLSAPMLAVGAASNREQPPRKRRRLLPPLVDQQPLNVSAQAPVAPRCALFVLLVFALLIDQGRGFGAGVKRPLAARPAQRRRRDRARNKTGRRCVHGRQLRLRLGPSRCSGVRCRRMA